MTKQMVRYYKLRKKMIDMLGGKCVRCGYEEKLEFDHVKPDTKEIVIGDSFNLSINKLENEVNKCQLLCKKCHTKKTIIDSGNQPAKGTHGTISAYRYCHCEICRKAKNDWTRNYRKTHPRKSHIKNL